MFGFKPYGNPPRIPYLKTAAGLVGIVISISTLGYFLDWVEPEKLEDPAYKPNSTSSTKTADEITKNLSLEECLVLYQEAKKRYDNLNEETQEIIKKIKHIDAASKKTTPNEL